MWRGDVAEHGVGRSYLIQHSAGSGKSNSITWAAFQLIDVYPRHIDVKGAKALDLPLFDSVIVVTDRRLLDKQLRENIKSFSEVKNILAPAHNSAELKTALEQGKKIIITTIQKFPFIVDGVANLSNKRFAVIIDEAHSSQSGSAHDNMNHIDFKVQAKQFVKIYAQMAAIMPHEIIVWEQLFWFLKLLMPKLVLKDPQQESIDEILAVVDLSSYGVERVKLGHRIELEAEEGELVPQNPKPRSSHLAEEEQDPLDEIIRHFNQRWADGWGDTPEEARVKFLSVFNGIQAHLDFEEKYKNNPDVHNRKLAFESIFDDIMLKRRDQDLQLYKLIATDSDFRTSVLDNLQQFLNRGPLF